MTSVVALVLAPDFAAHVVMALRGHEKSLSRMGLRAPEGVRQLEALCTSAARDGQGWTDVDVLQQLVDAVAMTPVQVRLLDRQQVAASLGVSERTLSRLVSSGELKAVRVGGSVRFRTQDVDDYVTSLGSEHSELEVAS